MPFIYHHRKIIKGDLTRNFFEIDNLARDSIIETKNWNPSKIITRRRKPVYLLNTNIFHPSREKINLCDFFVLCV